MPRKEQHFFIEDGSEDKKYFTIIPNYVLNHSTATVQSLYLQMKRVAGEKGYCAQPRSYFLKKMHIGKNAFNTAIKYMLDHKWLEIETPKVIDTAGGPQKVPRYKVTDLWQLNNEHYKKAKGGSPDDTPLPNKRGADLDPTLNSKGGGFRPKGGGFEATIEDPIKNININPIAEPSASALFSWKKYLEDMHSHKNRHVQIIAFYFQEKGLTFANREQAATAIKRHLRAAQGLVPFSDEQLVAGAKKAGKEYPEWTLETLIKVLTR